MHTRSATSVLAALVVVALGVPRDQTEVDETRVRAPRSATAAARIALETKRAKLIVTLSRPVVFLR